MIYVYYMELADRQMQYLPTTSTHMAVRQYLPLIRSQAQSHMHSQMHLHIHACARWVVSLVVLCGMLLGSCWEVAERLQGGCWEAAEMLLGSIWKAAERLLGES